MKGKVRLCLIGVTVCFALATVWAVLAVPGTALADKPVNGEHNHDDDPDGGGGDTGNQPCVIFDDAEGDSVQSDWFDPITGVPIATPGDNPYCKNKKEKITVEFLNRGGLRLRTGNFKGEGRDLFVDFGTDVLLAPGTVNEMTIQTTDDALALDHVSAVIGVVVVGGNLLDFPDMMPGDVVDTNLSMRVRFYFTDGSKYGLLLRLAPFDTGVNNRHCPTSDPVTVTYLGFNAVTELHEWRVETQEVTNGACISEIGEGEFLDTNLLLDVNDEFDPNPFELDPGHIALSFGFTITAAP